MSLQARVTTLPLEKKFALYVSVLLTAVVGAVVALAYYEIRSQTELAAHERLERSARRTAELLETNAIARGRALGRLARTPAVLDALTKPSPENAEAAIAAIRPARDTNTIYSIWTMEGTEVASMVARPYAAEELRADGFFTEMGDVSPDSTRTGRIHPTGDVPHHWVAAPVRDPSGRVIGFIADERRYRATPTALQRIQPLLADDAIIVLRNRDGSAWVNLSGDTLGHPSVTGSAPGALRYERGGTSYVGGSADVRGTPLMVIAERTESSVVGGAKRHLQKLLLVALVLGVISVALAAYGGRRLARPLAKLTGAAEGIAAGDYSKRVGVAGPDEVGRLGAAFDQMAKKVEESYESSVALRMEAEAANRAKSDFLATMSHEIRTPINAMIGYAELMHMGIAGQLNDQQRQHVDRIRASGVQLTSIVDDILDLAKIEARQMEVARIPSLASQAIERAVTQLRPQAQAKGVSIIESEEGEVGVRYLGDPQRVQQVLANLLSNAIKFTAPGGHIRVSCGMGPMPVVAAGHQAGAAAYIAVTDTGIGIAKDDFERIFEPFVQVDGSYKRAHGGSGLGLAISRTLTEIMGGALTVESTQGAGSKFTLWLPLALYGKARVPTQAAQAAAR